MSGTFHEGIWYVHTGMVCRRCGHPVYRSDNPEYSYQCFRCDEDLFEFEVKPEKGCAFEIRHDGKCRYYVSDLLGSMADLAVFLLRNHGQEMAGVRAISAGEWHELADHPGDSAYGAFVEVDMDAGTLLANEDAGDGMAYYLFPLGAVLDEARVDPQGLWKRLLSKFPGARRDRAD